MEAVIYAPIPSILIELGWTFVRNAVRKIYWGLGSPLLLDHEHLWILLADGFARLWTGVLKKEALKLQNLDEIADPYQKLYKCATEGRLDQFLVTVVKRESTNDANVDIQLLCELSPLKNTFLHIAVSFGHEILASEIVKLHKPLLLKKNFQGDTALHIAARDGNLDMVKYLCSGEGEATDIENDMSSRNPGSGESNATDIENDRMRLLRMKNDEDNMALHEALINGHKEVAAYLIVADPDHDHSVSFSANKEGKSPLYLAIRAGDILTVECISQRYQSPGNLAVEGKSPLHGAILDKNKALKSGGAQRAQPLHVLLRTNVQSPQQDDVGGNDGHVATMSQDFRDEIINSCRADRIELQFPNKKSYKDRVNTLLVVTTLVATVTFAAGFTMPGGYHNSGPREGKATLLTKVMFQVFVISNTLAMYSSIFVAVTLIWAQVGDLILVFTALRLVMPLLGIALGMLSLAFMAGVYVVVSNLLWLSIVVLVIGICFLYSVLILFSPLFFPNTTPTFRYITYYPFYLVALLAAGSHSNDLEEEE
ncbi:hypothetical protein GBA52_010627 [Prunus armeniaca]|nr:hypothetical protein GBA52_010627 [Prunus armeniaca]